MRCGYAARLGEKLIIQLVCNNNQSWYKRESDGSGFGAWEGIYPPTIINDCWKLDGVMWGLTRLKVEPFNVPQR